MAITVFDGVAKFTADSSALDAFTVKLEQGLTTASQKAAAATRELKTAQEEFRAAIQAVTAEGGNTAANLQRLADAEKNLALAAAASKQEHSNLKESLGAVQGSAKDTGESMEKAGSSMMEARHSVMLLGEQMGVHIPRAVASMLAHIGPLGSLLSAAFPVLGVLALIEVISKAIEHHDKLREAMRKAAEEAENLKIKEEDRTASLEVQNLRLEDSIKKLEGHPATNQLAIALREVQTRADELATSFAKDFQTMDHEVMELNSLTQKFADYVVNALKSYSTVGVLGVLANAKEILTVRGQETEAVKHVQEAEEQLEKARLASHEAAGKDAATQQLALGQQAIAAGNLQKAYDQLADSVQKVDPNNHELISKLRNSATSAEADWKDLEQEIKGVGLTAKETAETVANELAKRAEEFSKIKIGGREQLGILDANAILQAGEQAYAAEQAAIKKLIDADVQGGQDRAQVELSLIPRMEAAEKALNAAQLAALKAGHAARMQELEATRADILKYERGDEQLKALQDNQNKQNEENKKYELDREKIASEGEVKLTDIANKGAGDRIALQQAMKKAVLELAKADEELLKMQTQLGATDLSGSYKRQEEAINRLAQFHLISEQEKAQRLALLYKQESDAAVEGFEDAQRKIAETVVKGNPLFTDAQREELDKNLRAAEGDFSATIEAIKAAYGQVLKENPFLSESQITQLKTDLAHAEAAVTQTQQKIVAEKIQINDKLLALDKSYYGEAVSLAVANGQAILAAQLQENHALLVAAEQRLATAKSRHEDAEAAAQEVAALKKVEEGLTKEALGHKHNQAAMESAIHAAALDAHAQLEAARARGLNTVAIEKEIQELLKVEADLKKETQETQVSTKQQLSAWQQFGAGFRDDIQKNTASLEQMGEEMRSDIGSLATDLGQAFAAMAEGQKSAGEAIEEAMAKLIAQIAKQWAQYFEAMAIADIFFNPAKAAAELAAAVALEVLAGVLGSVGSGSHGSSAGSKSSSHGSAVSSKDQAVKAQPEPVQVVNVQSFATGGLASVPTLAVIGDSDHGGAAKEAVIPLENQHALNAIAEAIIPALLRAIAAPGNSDVAFPFIPRFAEGALVTSPLLAVVGDSVAGGAATEGILPLDNSVAMAKIASAIASQLSHAPLPAERRAEAVAINALLSPGTLASAGAAIQHQATPQEFAEAQIMANERNASQIARTLAQALDHKAPVSGPVTINVEGVISADNLDKVMQQINHRVRTGRTKLLASDSVRLTRRS